MQLALTHKTVERATGHREGVREDTEKGFFYRTNRKPSNRERHIHIHTYIHTHRCSQSFRTWDRHKKVMFQGNQLKITPIRVGEDGKV